MHFKTYKNNCEWIFIAITSRNRYFVRTIMHTAHSVQYTLKNLRKTLNSTSHFCLKAWWKICSVVVLHWTPPHEDNFGKKIVLYNFFTKEEFCKYDQYILWEKMCRDSAERRSGGWGGSAWRPWLPPTLPCCPTSSCKHRIFFLFTSTTRPPLFPPPETNQLS